MADKEFSAAALFGEEENEEVTNKKKHNIKKEVNGAFAFTPEKKKVSEQPERHEENVFENNAVTAKRDNDISENDTVTEIREENENDGEKASDDSISELYELFKKEREAEQNAVTIKDRLGNAVQSAKKSIASVKNAASKSPKIKKDKSIQPKENVVFQTEKADAPITTACATETECAKALTQEPTLLGRLPKKTATLIALVATVLIFAAFLGFLIKQYSYSYLSHDDYGYATLSYVYWEDGMWGQNFSLSQLTHYLTEHYNRWGGRILSFGQNILLFKAGTNVIQAFNAVVLAGIYLMSFLLAQNSKKTKWLPLAALFTCALFGFTGESIATSGMYWYSASILYMVPVIYIFLGTWLMYLMMLDEVEHTVSVSKIMMLPLACVLMFFGGFSLEHNGIFAVAAAGAMCVYTSFKKHNPINLIYGILPFLSSVLGCHIMLMAVGNNSRKSSYSEYYALPFVKQILTSGKNIVQTLFTSGNMMFVLLLATVTVFAAIFLLRKKSIFFKLLLGIDIAAAASSVAVAYGNIKTDKTAILMWVYLVLMAVTVSIWLFKSGKKQDMLVWILFLGGLASQGACLISPIFPSRCLLPFVLTFALVASRAFNEVLCSFEKMPQNTRIQCACAALIPVLVISAFGAGKIYNGFKDNEPVQSYNERMLKVVSYEYTELNQAATEITLMKLKSDAYAGSTQPYGRDLIKDWLKIYYKLPDNLQYEDFVYEDYDEERLAELEELLTEKEELYFSQQQD